MGEENFYFAISAICAFLHGPGREPPSQVHSITSKDQTCLTQLCHTFHSTIIAILGPPPSMGNSIGFSLVYIITIGFPMFLCLLWWYRIRAEEKKRRKDAIMWHIHKSRNLSLMVKKTLKKITKKNKKMFANLGTCSWEKERNFIFILQRSKKMSVGTRTEILSIS